MHLVFNYICAIVIIAVSTSPTYAGIAASHVHVKHNTKERLKDGVYSVKNSQGHDNEGHSITFDHEAIIGNVKEAEEFDQLSPEESKKRLTIILRLMDLNKDQHIDKHELKAWILRSFKKLSEEEAADRFEEIDQNQDDLITWKEYMQDVYAMENENHKKDIIDADSYEDEQKLIRDDKEMFSLADVNNDGQLTVDEFLMFQNPEESPQMLPLVLEHTLREKDKNNDGKIDFQEFVGESAEHHDKEWLITEKNRFDKEFDANGDGTLTGNEILSWSVPSNVEVAKDEVDHLFVSTDENQDDRLSYLEILNNYETFVGSEATDYGDHLQNIHHFADEL